MACGVYVCVSECVHGGWGGGRRWVVLRLCGATVECESEKEEESGGNLKPQRLNSVSDLQTLLALSSIGVFSGELVHLLLYHCSLLEIPTANHLPPSHQTLGLLFSHTN